VAINCRSENSIPCLDLFWIPLGFSWLFRCWKSGSQDNLSQKAIRVERCYLIENPLCDVLRKRFSTVHRSLSDCSVSTPLVLSKMCYKLVKRDAPQSKSTDLIRTHCHRGNYAYVLVTRSLKYSVIHFCSDGELHRRPRRTPTVPSPIRPGFRCNDGEGPCPWWSHWIIYSR